MNYQEIALNITGITSDSRKIEQGYAFVAITGEVMDGHEYINEAIAKGAKYIIHEQDISSVNNHNVIFIKVSSTRIALGKLASAFYQASPSNIVAVTGTNGKTSVVTFFQQMLELAGHKSASIGTIGVQGFSSDSSLTTPDPVLLHKLLKQASDENVEYLAIEASSHGLQQLRLHQVPLKAAGFTNFTQDHLDYHEDFEDYFNAKMLLFREVLQNGYAIINADIPEYNAIKKICLENAHKIIDYGKNAEVIKLESIQIGDNQQNFTYSYKGKKYSIAVNLVGEFQIYNLLCSLGFALSLGIDAELLANIIPQLKNVPGRMDKAILPGKNIYIDYAHTPDALKKSLLSLRPFVKSRLIVLFGCGGDRDKTKRPLMGKCANNYADYVIITDDNPRSEDASSIREEILASCPTAIEISDREKAIKFAIKEMQPGDILLIAGKGHENYQIIGKEKHHFSDKEVAESLD